MRTNQLDERLAAAMANGGTGHHEFQPHDFGADSGRAILFRECLRMVINRYPGIQLRLAGTRDALAQLSAIPGVDIQLGSTRIAVQERRTDAIGAVRIEFTRLG